MTVDELMTPTVVTCAPDDTLNRAAQLLWERDCGCLPVVADGSLIGMLTDRDICMAAYTKGRALHEIRVDEIMSTDVKSCIRTDSIEAVQTLMQMHQLRRVPVVDQDKLIGIISLTDLRIRPVEATLAAGSRPRQRAAARAVTA